MACRRKGGDDDFFNLSMPRSDAKASVVFVQKVKSKKPVNACIYHYGVRAKLTNGKKYFVHKVLSKDKESSGTLATDVTSPGEEHYEKYDVHETSDTTSVPESRDVTIPDLIDASDQKINGVDFHYLQNNCKDAMNRMYDVATGKTGIRKRPKMITHQKESPKRGNGTSAVHREATCLPTIVERKTSKYRVSEKQSYPIQQTYKNEIRPRVPQGRGMDRQGLSPIRLPPVRDEKTRPYYGMRNSSPPMIPRMENRPPPPYRRENFPLPPTYRTPVTNMGNYQPPPPIYRTPVLTNTQPFIPFPPPPYLAPYMPYGGMNILPPPPLMMMPPMNNNPYIPFGMYMYPPPPFMNNPFGPFGF